LFFIDPAPTSLAAKGMRETINNSSCCSRLDCLPCSISSDGQLEKPARGIGESFVQYRILNPRF